MDGTTLWTSELVGRRLIEAFRRMPSTGLYVTLTTVQRAMPGVQLPGLNIITLTARYLGAASDPRIKVLTWARAKAVGPSVREICREKGWSRTSFDRVRKAALQDLAAAFNRDGVARS